MANADLSDAIQDYLKEIYKLGTETERVSTSALAERQRVSAASASAMVKKLAALGLAEHAPYRGVTLTHAGEQVALEVIRHHRLLELYLAETLGIASTTSTTRPTGSSTRSRTSWRRGSTRRSASRPTIRTATRSRTPTWSGRKRPSGSEEEAFEHGQNLLARERLDPLGRAVVLEHPRVVLEGTVGGVERVAELVPLEEVVVAPGLAAGPVLRIDGAADGPERALLALEPDHDSFLAPRVVEPLQSPLGAPAVGADLAH